MVASTREASVIKRFYAGTFAPPSGFASTARGPEVTAEEILAGGVRESDWSFPVLISTGNIDRQGDVLVPEGCDYAAFAMSPIVHFEHAEVKFPVGLMRGPDGRLYFLIIPGVGILGRVWIRQPQPDDPPAYAEACKTVWITVRDGLLNGISVGMDPIGSVKGLPGGGSLYKNWELLEVSAVAVAANRDCRVLREPFVSADFDQAILKRFAPSVIKGLKTMSVSAPTAPAVRITKHIRKEGDEYVLYDHTGSKVLGRHKTREEAVKQEEAVKASEARAKSYAVKYRAGEWSVVNKRTRTTVSKHKTRGEVVKALAALRTKGMSESDGAEGGYVVPEEHAETVKTLAARMKDYPEAKGHEFHFNAESGELRHVHPEDASEEHVKGIAGDLADVPGVKSVASGSEKPGEGEGFQKVYECKDMDEGEGGGEGESEGDEATMSHTSSVSKRAKRMARVGKAIFKLVRKGRINGWVGSAIERRVKQIMPTLLKAEMAPKRAIAVAWGIAGVQKGFLPLVAKSATDPDEDGDDDTTDDPVANPDAAEDAAQDAGADASADAGQDAAADASTDASQDAATDAATDAADDAAMDAAMDADEESQAGPDGLELAQAAIENIEAMLPKLEPERREFWAGLVDQIRSHAEELYPDEDFGGEDETAASTAADEGENRDAAEQKVSDEMLARYKGGKPKKIKRISIVRKLKSMRADPGASDIIRKAANHLHEIGDMEIEQSEKGCRLKGYTPAHHRGARIRARELDRLHGAIMKGEEPAKGEEPEREEKPESSSASSSDSLDMDALMPHIKSLNERLGGVEKAADEVRTRAGARRRA